MTTTPDKVMIKIMFFHSFIRSYLNQYPVAADILNIRFLLQKKNFHPPISKLHLHILPIVFLGIIYHNHEVKKCVLKFEHGVYQVKRIDTASFIL
jgi:hypothetical protein